MKDVRQRDKVARPLRRASLPSLRVASDLSVSAHEHACRLDIKSAAAIERAGEGVSE